VATKEAWGVASSTGSVNRATPCLLLFNRTRGACVNVILQCCARSNAHVCTEFALVVQLHATSFSMRALDCRLGMLGCRLGMYRCRLGTQGCRWKMHLRLFAPTASDWSAAICMQALGRLNEMAHSLSQPFRTYCKRLERSHLYASAGQVGRVGALALSAFSHQLQATGAQPFVCKR
jgi:hypothetical protein